MDHVYFIEGESPNVLNELQLGAAEVFFDSLQGGEVESHEVRFLSFVEEIWKVNRAAHLLKQLRDLVDAAFINLSKKNTKNWKEFL